MLSREELIEAVAEAVELRERRHREEMVAQATPWRVAFSAVVVLAAVGLLVFVVAFMRVGVGGEQYAFVDIVKIAIASLPYADAVSAVEDDLLMAELYSCLSGFVAMIIAIPFWAFLSVARTLSQTKQEILDTANLYIGVICLMITLYQFA